MPAITHSDYILQKATAASTLVVVPGVWVRLLNNSTATNYYSTAVTDAQGAFTHSAVPGDYSLYYGTAATVIGTPNLVNAHYPVPVTAGDDVAAGSYSALASSPYAPNLPGTGGVGQVATTATPAGIMAGKHYDYGGRAFHAGAFGAKGDGIVDDTTALAAAITAATPPLGGEVFVGAGTYKTTGALTIPSTVWLVGAKAPMGMIFGDTLSGTVIQPTTGAFNCIQTPSATQNRGGGLLDIGIDGFTDTTHWAVRVFGATGFTMTNVAVRQAATNANGILIGGGAGSALQCYLNNISINCGGGFVGAVGLQMGITGTEIANANTGTMVQVQGYNINVNCDNGGNTFHTLWTQFPTTGTGIRFNSSIGSVFGGWFESLSVAVVFTVNTTNCLVIGARRSGAVTTLYTDAGTGNRIIAFDNNDYGAYTQVGNYAITGTLNVSSTVTSGGISSINGTPGLTFADRTGGQLWQWYGTSAIARLYSGTADLFQIDNATGKILMVAKTATAGIGVPAIYQAPAPLTAQTAAVASVATLTSPNDGIKHTYMVSGFVTITTLGSGSFNLQVSYTDSSGTARTTTIPLCAQAGTFAALANTADDYKGAVEITVNPSTAVTIKTTGTFTGCTYNVGGNIKQVL